MTSTHAASTTGELEDQYTHADGVEWTRSGDQVVIVDIANNSYHILNGVGAFIWQALGDDAGVGEIVEVMAEHFDVPPEQAREDVVKFLNDSVEQGLLVRKG